MGTNELGRLLCDLVEAKVILAPADDGHNLSVLWQAGRDERLCERIKAHKHDLLEVLAGRGACVAGYWALLYPDDAALLLEADNCTQQAHKGQRS